MSFAAGMAAGMGGGIGVGVAIGTTSGEKQARDKLCRHFENHGITLQDQKGKQILIDDALDDALRCNASEKRTLPVVLLVVGLLVSASIAGVLYFVVANG
jgi:hypothetical protein